MLTFTGVTLFYITLISAFVSAFTHDQNSSDVQFLISERQAERETFLKCQTLSGRLMNVSRLCSSCLQILCEGINTSNHCSKRQFFNTCLQSLPPRSEEVGPVVDHRLIKTQMIQHFLRDEPDEREEQEKLDAVCLT